MKLIVILSLGPRILYLSDILPKFSFSIVEHRTFILVCIYFLQSGTYVLLRQGSFYASLDLCCYQLHSEDLR